MRRSVPLIILLACGLASCSMLGLGRKPKAAPPKVVTARTATMDLTPGITVSALVRMPPGFIPIAGEPPLWLQNATEIALLGSLNGRTEMLGFSGNQYKKERLIAADGGPGAPRGRIVGVAASPDGMTLAVAESEPGRIEIVVRYVLSKGGENSVASFDGNFHAVTVRWVGPTTLAVGLGAETSAPPSAPAGTARPGAPTAGQQAVDAEGLFLINVAGAVTVERIKISCPISPLAFSPDQRFVVGEGDAAAAPMIFDRQGGACRHLGLAGPIRVLGWAPGDAAFLYAAPASNAAGPGVFRYALASGKTDLIAVASGAAAYLTSGAILALGNSDLSFRAAMATPNRIVTAQIAIFDPHQSQIHVHSLGTPTTAAMLMASTMTYSPALAQVAMQLYAASPQGPVREIVTYSLASGKAFVLARGALGGTAVLGWPPAANLLVVFDGDDARGKLAVIAPSS